MTTSDHEAFDMLNQRVERGFKEVAVDLAEVKAQTRLTNGRVGALELSQAKQQGFLTALSLVLGLPAVLGTIIGIVLGLRELS